MIYDELEPKQGRTGEIILGNGKLTAIFLASAVICGLCFGLGYSLGRHTAAKAAEVDASTPSSPAPVYATGTKPSPGSSPAEVASEPESATVAPDSPPADAPPATRPTAHATKSSSTRPDAPKVSPPSTTKVSGNGGFVVQVAAISRRGDADILLGALLRKGYQVSAVTNPQDHLIHIQMGPFSNQKDAAAMRDRLSNDGYLAMIK